MFKLVVLALAVSTVYSYGSPVLVGKSLGLGLSGKTVGLGLTGKTVGLGLTGKTVGLGLGLRAGIASPIGLSRPVIAAPIGLSRPVITAPIALAGGYTRQAIAGPIVAAVHSTRSYEVVPVAARYEAPIAQTIDIPANVQPINMIFRTQSSPLNVQQIHTPAAGTHQSSRSEDAPSVLTHESYKPVIQEFREVIQPFRKIEQRIEPVIEHVHTVVSKGEQLAAPVLATPVEAVAAPVLATPVKEVSTQILAEPVEQVNDLQVSDLRFATQFKESVAPVLEAPLVQAKDY